MTTSTTSLTNASTKAQVRGMITTSTKDTPPDLRFFPRPQGADIQVPVFSLSPMSRGAR